MVSTTIQSAMATLPWNYRRSTTKNGMDNNPNCETYLTATKTFHLALTFWQCELVPVVKDLWIKKGKKTPPLTIVLRVQKFFDQPLCCSLFLLNCPTVLSFYDAKPRPGLPSTSLKQHQHLNQCPLLNTLDHCRRPSGRIFGPRLPLFDHHRHCSIFPLQLHPTFLSAFNWVMIINWGCLKKTKKGQLTD